MSKANPKMALQRKVSKTLLLSITAFTAISYVILSWVIAPAFDDLELSAATTDLVRAEQAINNDIENLLAITADWAPWDDIYEYVSGRYPAFKKSNLDRPTLTNLGLDMMAIYALDSRLMWSQLLIDGENVSVDTLGIMGSGDAGHDYLTVHAAADDITVGIVQTNSGPMIVSSRPILRSDGSGPVAGALVMAQFLNDARLQRLQEITAVHLDWTPVKNFDRHPGHDPRALADGEIHVVANDTTISTHTLLTDIFDAPVLVLAADTRRDITALGQRTITGAMMFLLIAGVLATIIMWFLLRRSILEPIESLADHMTKIRKSGDLSDKLNLNSDDEIGALAEQLDNLTSEVHDARKALLAQSFKAGKADTAAEVLHNIRNAMTPMINGVERVSKVFRATDDLRVAEATQQLTDPDCDPDRAIKLVEYIDASFEHLKRVNIDAVDDLIIVQSQARQIEAILSDQEKFAKVSPIAENIVIDEVFDEAAHVIPKDIDSNVNIQLEENLPRYCVRAHRVGLLQVLGNLILNAHESIQRGDKHEGQISLSATEAEVENRPMVCLTVRDNGCGFDKETGKRIFQRGFTSKGIGDSTGLGLHWCANAVASMGGRISAESLGAGRGAEFHVLLPSVPGG